MIGKIFHQLRPEARKFGHAGREWRTAFREQRQAVDRLSGTLKKSQGGVNAAVRDVHCVRLDILDGFGPSRNWFPVRHLLDAL